MLLSKYLHIDIFGILMVAINFYAILNIILDLKISDLLFRYYIQFEKNDELAAGSLIRLSLLICASITFFTVLLVLGCSNWIANIIYEISSLDSLIKAYLVGASVSTFMGFSTAALRIRNCFKQLVASQIAGNFLAVLFLAYYLIYLGKSNPLVVLSVISIGLLISTMMALYYAFVNLKIEFKEITKLWKIRHLVPYKSEIISLLFQTNLSAYLKIGAERGGVFLLGVFSTPSQVALYSLATQLVSPIKLVQSTVQAALYPEIVQLASSRDHWNLYRIIRNSTLILTVVGLVAFVFVAILVKPILLLVATEAYIGSSRIFLVMVLSSIITLAAVCFYPLTIITDQLKRRNLVVSLRFLYIICISIVQVSGFYIALAQLFGTVTTRVLHDLKLFKDIYVKQSK